ncbi:MAG: YigZ family protein [Oenococcus sp.]|uniref:YigZ family protein n=1 Tax=Oenococcus sp. TaxID=1979414 RepID=UPI0039E94DE2
MTELLTVTSHNSFELIEKKSRFIAEIFPIESEETAKNAIANVQQNNREANHFVFAYTLGLKSETQKESDNGEPSGTAGKPVLDVIAKNNLVNVLITVTRYFGGIKLGAGGLIRAYSGAAAKVVEQTKIFQLVLQDKLAVTADYASLDRLQYFIQQHHAEITKSDYGQQVNVILLIPTADSSRFQEELINLFSARIGIKKIAEILSPTPIKH